jgi:hypothetical protein
VQAKVEHLACFSTTIGATIMKRNIITAILGVAILAASGLASAQLGGFGKLGGGGNSGGAGPTADQIVSKYVKGTQSVMRANANMLSAVGLKVEGEKAALQAKNLTEGATKDSLEDASKVQTESSKALEAKLGGEKFKMDEASKKQYGEGMVDLAKGIIQYVSLSKDVSGFKPTLTSIGGASGSALYVAQSLPGSVKNLSQTLKMAINFSKANGIPVPKEANDATSML